MYHLIQQHYHPTSWDNIFFLEATLWSRRSHDTQTQCGCVLVKNKTNISSGYNGFIRGIDDHALPTTRPEKYPFMIHAEANAVYNAVRNGQSTLDATAYITAMPCLQCLQMLHQCGISEVCFSDISSPKREPWSRYEKILELVKDEIKFKFTPKSNLDNSMLLSSAKKFEK
jgi:deoxycytidylate deaminase